MVARFWLNLSMSTKETSSVFLSGLTRSRASSKYLTSPSSWNLAMRRGRHVMRITIIDSHRRAVEGPETSFTVNTYFVVTSHFRPYTKHCNNKVNEDEGDVEIRVTLQAYCKAIVEERMARRVLGYFDHLAARS